MARTTDWTGDAGNGLWSDPGNWSAGVPGRQATVTFDLAGQATTDVSLAPADFRHPVAGTVTMAAGSFVFEPGKLVIGQGGLTVENDASLTIARGAIVDARNSGGANTSALTVENGASLTIARGAIVDASNPNGSFGVSVSSGTLDVHGALKTAYLADNIGTNAAATQMLISGTGARVTVSQTAFVQGGTLAIYHGGRLTAGAVNVENQGETRGSLYVHGVGTVVDLVGLEVTGSAVLVTDGAVLAVNEGGMNRAQAHAPRPTITIAGNGATLSVAGTFDQTAGRLTIGQGGNLALQAGAAMIAGHTVVLAGGSITGSGTFELAGGTLVAGATQALDHDVSLGAVGTIEATTGNTLTLDGAITGSKATLTIGGSTETGTVVLTDSADSYGPTLLAGGTLELAADDVAGPGNIRFLPGDTATLRVDAGVAVGNTVMGFGAGDTIDLAGIGYGPGTTRDLTPRLYGGATLTVSDGTHTERLVLGTVGNPAGYTLSADGHGGTDVGYVPPQTG